jgi:hypothetical protein
MMENGGAQRSYMMHRVLEFRLILRAIVKVSVNPVLQQKVTDETSRLRFLLACHASTALGPASTLVPTTDSDLLNIQTLPA